MRDGWKKVAISDLCIMIKRGQAPTYTESKSVTVLNQKCVRDGKINLAFSRQTDATLKPVNDWAYLNASDTLVNSTGVGTLGRVAFVRNLSEPTTVDSHVTIVRPDNKKVEPSFLGLSLNFREVEIEGLAAGSSGQTELSREALGNLIIMLPTLPEQKRIVDLMSSVDSYIEALQQQLESAKRSKNALVESQIRDLSDSSLSSLKNLSTKIGSGATPRGGEEVYIETGVNLIRSQNVYDSNFVMRGLVAIEDSAAKALDNVTVEEGDVLINITGASVTRCCVVDSTILPARVNQHVAIIRSDRAKILPKYLVLVLTSNEVKGFLNDIAGTGSTRQALTKTHLEDLEIPVPSISKQAAIIENSDAFDATISKSQITLDRAKFLRSGLLSELLGGKHEIPASYDKVIGLA